MITHRPDIIDNNDSLTVTASTIYTGPWVSTQGIRDLVVAAAVPAGDDPNHFAVSVQDSNDASTVVSGSGGSAPGARWIVQPAAAFIRFLVHNGDSLADHDIIYSLRALPGE